MSEPKIYCCLSVYSKYYIFGISHLQKPRGLVLSSPPPPNRDFGLNPALRLWFRTSHPRALLFPVSGSAKKTNDFWACPSENSPTGNCQWNSFMGNEKNSVDVKLILAFTEGYKAWKKKNIGTIFATGPTYKIQGRVIGITTELLGKSQLTGTTW